MVLLDPVVERLRGSDFGIGGQQAVSLHLAHGPVRGRVAIECDGFRWLPLMFDGLLEKCFCCCHVAFGAQHEVYRLAGPIHRPKDPLKKPTGKQPISGSRRVSLELESEDGSTSPEGCDAALALLFLIALLALVDEGFAAREHE